MINLRTALAPAVGLALLTAACGGSDDASAADTELVDNLAASWTADEEFPDTLDVNCLADGFITGIGGADGAAEYGITPANIGEADFDTVPLSEEDARAAAASMFGCDGLKLAILSEMGPGVTDEQAACLSEQIGDEPMEALVASSFMGAAGASITADLESTFQVDFVAAFGECGVGV